MLSVWLLDVSECEIVLLQVADVPLDHPSCSKQVGNFELSQLMLQIRIHLLQFRIQAFWWRWIRIQVPIFLIFDTAKKNYSSEI